MIELKGLTVADRALWEKQYAAQLKGQSERDKDIMWMNYNLAKKYGQDTPSYRAGKGKNLEDAVKLWNESYGNDLYTSAPQKNKELTKEINRPIERSDSPSQSTTVQVKNFNSSAETKAAKESRGLDVDLVKARSNAYEESKRQLLNKYNRAQITQREDAEYVKELADEISPYYKRYKNDPSAIQFTQDDWNNLALEFNARKQSYSPKEAEQWLKDQIQDEVASHQTHLEKGWAAITGMGSKVAAFGIETAGLTYGLMKYITGNGNTDTDYWITNLLDTILDNEVTRYANDVQQAGSLFFDDIDVYKETGIGRNPILRTAKQEHPDNLFDAIFNENLIYDLVDQYGFTAASMGAAKGSSFLTSKAFRALKGFKLSRALNDTKKGIDAAKKSIQFLQNAEKRVNQFLIPGAIGTIEGNIEGLGNKLEVLEAGKEMIADRHKQLVDSKFQELMESYDVRLQNTINELQKAGAIDTVDMERVEQDLLDQIYQEAWDSCEGELADMQDKLYEDAATSGIITASLNSIINGFLNQTFKATQMAPKTKEYIRQTRLGKMFHMKAKPKFTITGTGADVTVKSEMKLPWWKAAIQLAEEPAGEFLEEFEQDVASDAAKAGALNDLRYFLGVKYDGETQKDWLDQFCSNLSAASSEALSSAMSMETWRDGIYGAMSSVLGGVAAPRMATKMDVNGKPIKSKNGGYEKTWGRGLNEKGEKETKLEMVARLMPWSSGVSRGYREIKNQIDEQENVAKAITNWLRKPENQAKYDGLVGSFSWGKLMETFAANNDEFGYRNSTLGKAISDAMTLNHLKGTDFYESFMSSVRKTAEVEAGSEYAKDVIAAFRNDAGSKSWTEEATDEEILDRAKKNAQRILDVHEKIDTASKQVEKDFGDVLDQDVKHKLIFDEIIRKDWEERHDALEKEISDTYQNAFQSKSTGNTHKKSERSNLTDEQKSLIVKHGSLEKAQSKKEQAEKQIQEKKEKLKEYNEKLDDLDRNKNTTKSDRRAKKQDLKGKINKLHSEISELENTVEGFNEVLSNTEGINDILNEDEIMALSPEERAEMLNSKPGKFSKKQQAVIDRLNRKLNNTDSDIANKIRDAGLLYENSQTSSLSYILNSVSPQFFNQVAQNARRAAKMVDYKEKYDKISAIEDYTEFAKELDNLYTNGSEEELTTVLRQLARDEQKRIEEGGEEGESNYSKYVEARTAIADLINSAKYTDAFQNLMQNDLRMLTHAITFLAERDVPISEDNLDEILATLSAVDENGNSQFQQYVEALRGEVADYGLTEFTSIGDVFSDLKNILNQVTKRVNEYNETHAQVSHSPTPEDSNNPPASPPTSGNEEQDNEQPQQQEKSSTDTILDKFRESGNQDDLLSDVQYLLNRIANHRDITEEEQDSMLEAINALAGTKFTNRIDLLNRLKEDANSKFTEIIRDRINIVQNEIARKKRDEELDRHRAEGEAASASERAKEALARDTLTSRSARRTPTVKLSPNANSAQIRTLNMVTLSQMVEDGGEQAEYAKTLLNYLNVHGTQQFLKTGEFEITPNGSVEVYYLHDESLTQSVKDAYGDDYRRDTDVPIVAVVKSKNGPIEINGVKYQPIGILPTSGQDGYSGSNRVTAIRNHLVESNDLKGQSLITSSRENRPLTSLLASNAIEATQPQVLPVGEEVTVLDACLANDKNVEHEITNIEGDSEKTKKQKRNANSAYKTLRRNFVRGLRKIGDARKQLVLDVSKLKPTTGETYQQEVTPTPVDKTVDVNTGLKFTDLLSLSDDRRYKALVSNSRVIGFLSSINSICKILNDYKGLSSDELLKAGENLTEALNGRRSNTQAANLTGSLDLTNNLYPSQNGNYGIELRTGDNGEIFGNLYFEDAVGNRVQLGILHQGGPNVITEENLSYDEQLTILKNLFLTEDGQPTNNVHWQIDFEDANTANAQYDAESGKFKKSNGKEVSQEQVDVAKRRLESAFDDGLLQMSKATTEYTIKNVVIESPFDREGNELEFKGVKGRFKKKIKLTTDIASPVRSAANAASRTVEASDGRPINPDTGQALDDTNGNTSRPLTPKERCEVKITAIQNAYRERKATEDGNHEEDKSGTKYISVTTLISSDEENDFFSDKKESKDEIKPATEIGTGFDEFIRDFLSGDKMYYDENRDIWVMNDGTPLDEVYPNANARKLSNIARQITTWKNSISVSKGLTFVTRDIGVRGSITVTDSHGQQHVINTSGVLDLLAYDNDGNWYLYDIKTFSGETPEISKDSWARQLTLYKELLRQNGIDVKEMGILPIQVKYDKRGKFTRSDKPKHQNYNGKQNNQLLRNGVEMDVMAQIYGMNTQNSDPIIRLEGLPLHALAGRLEKVISRGDAAVNQDRNVQLEGQVRQVQGFNRHNISEIINPNGSINFEALSQIAKEYFESAGISETLETRREHHAGELFTREHLENVVATAQKLGVNRQYFPHLILAAALHDIAKPLHGENHAIDSLHMIDEMFEGELNNLVRFAVKNHMFTARQGEPFTIDDAQRIVEDARSLNIANIEEAIDMLLVLNAADIIHNRPLDSTDNYKGENIPLWQIINRDITEKLSLFEKVMNPSSQERNDINSNVPREEQSMFDDLDLDFDEENSSETSSTSNFLASTYIENPDLRWESMTDEVKAAINAMGITEEIWNSNVLSDRTKEHIKDCCS